MAIGDILKVNLKTFINVRGWLGWDFIKQQTLLVIALIKAIFIPTPHGQAETFEEAQKRFDLKDEDLKSLGTSYFRFAIFYFILGLILILSSIYLLISGTFAGFILALAFSAYLFGQAFQNHFWYFQIKNRKLGLTYEEWLHGRPKEGGPSE